MTLFDLANPTRCLTLTARILPWLAAATVILLPIGVLGARAHSITSSQALSAHRHYPDP
jgi:hypothetical protein